MLPLHNIKNDKLIKQPNDVINQTKEYFYENDPIKLCFFNYCQLTDKSHDQIKNFNS